MRSTPSLPRPPNASTEPSGYRASVWKASKEQRRESGNRETRRGLWRGLVRADSEPGRRRRDQNSRSYESEGRQTGLAGASGSGCVADSSGRSSSYALADSRRRRLGSRSDSGAAGTSASGVAAGKAPTRGASTRRAIISDVVSPENAGGRSASREDGAERPDVGAPVDRRPSPARAPCRRRSRGSRPSASRET